MFKSPCYSCQYQFQENMSRVMGHCFPLTWYQVVHLETTTTLRASRPQGNNFFAVCSILEFGGITKPCQGEH